MSDKTYAIAFDGTLVEGAKLDQVKANVAKLFKAPLAKVEPLFCGKRIAIKRGLDKATALKYQVALRKCGAVTQVVDTAAAAKKKAQILAAKKKQAQAAAAKQQAVAQPAPDTGLVRSVVKEAPSGDVLAGVSIDAPERISPEEEVEELQVDISQFDTAEAGTLLVEPEPDVELDIDIPDLGVADPGAQLTEPHEEETLEVDLSGFSMAEPGEQIVEPEEIEELQVDTSNLKLGT